MIEEPRVSSAPLRISFCPLSPSLVFLNIPFCILEYFDLEGFSFFFFGGWMIPISLYITTYPL